jgi:antitoxin VapB
MADMSGVKEVGMPFLHNHAEDVGRAKVFMHGGSQAVRLPKAFRVEGDEVSVRREGDKVILETKRRQGGAELWARIDAIPIDEPLAYPPQPVIEDHAGFED